MPLHLLGRLQRRLLEGQALLQQLPVLLAALLHHLVVRLLVLDGEPRLLDVVGARVGRGGDPPALVHLPDLLAPLGRQRGEHLGAVRVGLEDAAVGIAVEGLRPRARLLLHVDGGCAGKGVAEIRLDATIDRGRHAVELPGGLHVPVGAKRLRHRLVHLFLGVVGGVLVIVLVVKRRGVWHLDLPVEEAAVVVAGVVAGAVERAGLTVAFLAVALGPLLHVLLGEVAVVAQLVAAGAVAEGPRIGAAVEPRPQVRVREGAVGCSGGLLVLALEAGSHSRGAEREKRMGTRAGEAGAEGVAVVNVVEAEAPQEVGKVLLALAAGSGEVLPDTLVDVLGTLLLLGTIIITTYRPLPPFPLFGDDRQTAIRGPSTVLIRHFNPKPNVSLRTLRNLAPLPLRTHVGAVIERARDLLNPRRLIGCRLAVVLVTADAAAVATDAAEVVGSLAQHLDAVALDLDLIALAAAVVPDRLKEERDGVVNAHPAAAAPLLLLVLRLRRRLLLAPGVQLLGCQLLLGGLAELRFRGRELALLADLLAETLAPLFPFFGLVDLSLSRQLFVCLGLFGLKLFDLLYFAWPRLLLLNLLWLVLLWLVLLWLVLLWLNLLYFDLLCFILP
ncbi:hypothetical protein PG997_012030 [Apiospora hydei]|uniref:Uncharacterized protein n=1 Tax=Apiospora hydei TaxID=1337664 RepID=A0ABR1V5K9_9PEZI